MKKIENILNKLIGNFKIVNKKANKYLLIADRLNVDTAIRSSLLGLIKNKEKNLNIVVVSDYKDHISHKIYKIFGINEIYKFTKFIKENLIDFKILLVYLCKISEFLFSFIFFQNYLKHFIENFKIQDIIVGDLLYDIYVRYNNNYLKFNKKKIFTLFIIHLKIFI